MQLMSIVVVLTASTAAFALLQALWRRQHRAAVAAHGMEGARMGAVGRCLLGNDSVAAVFEIPVPEDDCGALLRGSLCCSSCGRGMPWPGCMEPMQADRAYPGADAQGSGLLMRVASGADASSSGLQPGRPRNVKGRRASTLAAKDPWRQDSSHFASSVKSLVEADEEWPLDDALERAGQHGRGQDEEGPLREQSIGSEAGAGAPSRKIVTRLSSSASTTGVGSFLSPAEDVESWARGPASSAGAPAPQQGSGGGAAAPSTQAAVQEPGALGRGQGSGQGQGPGALGPGQHSAGAEQQQAPAQLLMTAHGDPGV